jgi:hypothetical protein
LLATLKQTFIGSNNTFFEAFTGGRGSPPEYIASKESL